MASGTSSAGGASATGIGGGTLNVTSEGLGVGSAPQGSLLQRLGLHPGDVVKSINGQPIGASTDVTRLYQSIVNGESVSAEVVRGGQTVQVQLTAPSLTR